MNKRLAVGCTKPQSSFKRLKMQSTALRYFCEVVRSGSLRRAAEILHIAPSAISRQISHLEHRVKAPLFERQTNKLVLTEQGRILADYAETIDQGFRNVMVAIDDVSGYKRGHVRVATVEAMVAHVLARCISVFQSDFPNLTVSVEVMGTAHVVEAVVHDTADVGIAFCPEARDEIQTCREWAQPLHVIVGPNNPLAEAKEIALSDLSEFRVALPTDSFGIRRLVESALQKTSVQLVRILETNSIEMVKGMVRHSSAITFLPRSAVLHDLQYGALCAIPLRDPDLSGTNIALLAMRGRSMPKAASAFMKTFNTVTDQALTPS